MKYQTFVVETKVWELWLKELQLQLQDWYEYNLTPKKTDTIMTEKAQFQNWTRSNHWIEPIFSSSWRIAYKVIYFIALRVNGQKWNQEKAMREGCTMEQKGPFKKSFSQKKSVLNFTNIFSSIKPKLYKVLNKIYWSILSNSCNRCIYIHFYDMYSAI